MLIKAIRENLPKEIETKFVKIKEKETLYKKFIDNYNGNFTQKRLAIEAAKEYIKKYSGNAEDKEIIDYLIKVIPEIEKTICCVYPEPDTSRYYKFDNSLKNKKWNDLFDAGAEILKTEPEFVDVTLVLASVGFDIAVKESKREYLNQTLNYAEKSIYLLENDKASPTGNYGAFDYSYKTKEFPDGKANALGYMNYIIGYIKYFYLNQKDEAIPYFQKSLNYKSKSNELVRQLDLPSEIKQ